MSGQITLTERAATQINKIVGEDSAAIALRITVEGGGCSGFQYIIELTENNDKDDVVFVRDGAKLVIDQTSLPFMLGCEVDFVDDLIGSQFQIKNPNVSASCGCGTSFSM